jgi:tetratricopeptide (TPR) repeat protein
MRKSQLNEVVWSFAAALGLVCAAPSFGETQTPAISLDESCGPAPPGHPVKGRRDYRLMSSNAKDLRDLKYHGYFHIEPAQKQLRAGKNLSWQVMNNLHFVLHKVPNDHRALHLLIEWDKSGGKDSDYASPGCYLTWARQFAPDDTMVWTLGGQYFYQNKNLDLARQWWEQAVVLAPGNIDVHYNLGLLMFEQRRYPDARIHAQTAYAAGYPLPGLREKLKKAGEWRDPLQAEE